MPLLDGEIWKSKQAHCWIYCLLCIFRKFTLGEETREGLGKGSRDGCASNETMSPAEEIVYNVAMQILSTKYNKYKCKNLRDCLATLHTNTHSHRRVWRRIVWGGERRCGRRKRILASSVLGRVRVVPGEKHKNANVFWEKYGKSKICKYTKFHLEREGVVRREEW